MRSRIQTITLSLGHGRLQNALCPLATMLGWRLALSLLFVSAAVLVQPSAATPSQWDFTGSLLIARYYHTATLLPDGRVLVAGGTSARPRMFPNPGFPYPGIASAELYDPATGNWTATGILNAGRLLHTATLLPNGKVLVAGGWPDHTHNGIMASAELYDPTTGNWTRTGSMNVGRAAHTATLLPNGKVLVAGGWPDHTHNGIMASAELYDPATGTWTRTGSMNVGRAAHTATLLPNGKVLVVGASRGFPNSAELYDPATGNWSFTGSTVTPLFGYHTATLLPNGKVLAAAGYDTNGHVSANAQLYDPATGTWTATGSLTTERQDHKAALLSNGMVLVAGGSNFVSGILASAELYDPVTGTWTGAGRLNVARWHHTATLLSDGTVLVAGGLSRQNSLTSAEIYDPATGNWTVTDSLNDPRGLHTATLLSDGKVLAAGGNNNGAFVATAELYGPSPTPSP